MSFYYVLAIKEYDLSNAATTKNGIVLYVNREVFWIKKYKSLSKH
jgi:hypothetical protein